MTYINIAKASEQLRYIIDTRPDHTVPEPLSTTFLPQPQKHHILPYFLKECLLCRAILKVLKVTTRSDLAVLGFYFRLIIGLITNGVLTSPVKVPERRRLLPLHRLIPEVVDIREVYRLVLNRGEVLDLPDCLAILSELLLFSGCLFGSLVLGPTLGARTP